MSYLKLLNAKRKTGNQPGMKPLRLTDEQKALAAEGRCIKCRTPKSNRHSYLCRNCQAEDTIEEIRDDIKALRHKILSRSESE